MISTQPSTVETIESQSPSVEDKKIAENSAHLSDEEIAKKKRQEALNKDPDYVRTMAMINETQDKNKKVKENNFFCQFNFALSRPWKL